MHKHKHSSSQNELKNHEMTLEIFRSTSFASLASDEFGL